MRVLILSYEYPPIGGGTGWALSRLLPEWAKQTDLELTVWTAQAPQSWAYDTPLVDGVAYRFFPVNKQTIHYWRTTEQLRLLVSMSLAALRQRGSYELVLVWGGLPLGLLLAGPLRAKRAVLALRGSDVPGYNPRCSGGIWRTVARTIWNQAEIITVNSPALAQLAHQTQPERALEMIPNGVDFPTELTDPAYHDPDRYRRILIVSRLIPRKQIELALEGCARLRQQGQTDWKLTIIGEGPLEGQLRNQARSLGIAEQITFAGSLSHQQVLEHYRSHGQFVLASRAEGLSNALLEAMAHQLVCWVATPTGLDDIDQSVGFFSNSEELGNCLNRACQTPSEACDRARAARTVAAGYRWSEVARSYAKLFEKVTSTTKE